MLEVMKMNEFKGTPGPWFWQGGVLCNKDFIIGGLGHNFNNQANKNLITAAPELLEALQRMLRAGQKQNWNERYESEMQLARAAIAKALGESK
jgi:hypothetical protein